MAVIKDFSIKDIKKGLDDSELSLIEYDGNVWWFNYYDLRKKIKIYKTVFKKIGEKQSIVESMEDRDRMEFIINNGGNIAIFRSGKDRDELDIDYSVYSSGSINEIEDAVYDKINMILDNYYEVYELIDINFKKKRL